VMVKIRGAYGQMNIVIHKFQNFKIKFLKLSVGQIVKFLKFEILLLLF